MHFCVSATRGGVHSGFCCPRKIGTNWFMPAFVKSRFGASGSSDADGTMVCCFSRKKSRKDWRISAAVMRRESQGTARNFQMEMLLFRRHSRRQVMEPGGQKTIRARIAAIKRGQTRELGVVISIWFVLAITMLLLAKENLSVPGLYYDEAVFAGMAKDFLTGQVHGQHMPGHVVTQIFGRPFPFFIQIYLGALKSWMFMPGLGLFGYSVAVLRATNLFWGFVALLFFMLG